jgi:hypothetical protein
VEDDQVTYIAKRRAARVSRSKRQGLGSWIDDLLQQGGIPTESSQCLDQANAQVAPFEGKIADMDKTWNPTGFYTPADLRQVVSSTLSVVQQGYAALSQAMQQASSSSLNEANAELSKASGNSMDYLNAAKEAESKGVATVNAPGLKRWVISTMQSASNAIVAGAVTSCMEPWWLSAVAAFQQAFDVAWQVIKQVAGAVLKLGEVALKVPDLLDDIVTYGQWALLLGLAYFAFTSLADAHGRHESGL